MIKAKRAVARAKAQPVTKPTGPPGQIRRAGQYGPARPPSWTKPPLVRLRTALKLSRNVPVERVMSEAADRLEQLLEQTGGAG